MLGKGWGFEVVMDFVYYHGCITNSARIDHHSRAA